MILSDKKIFELVDSKQLIIEPDFDKKNIRPVGIRFHLGEDILIPVAGQTVDITKPEQLKYDQVKLKDEGYILKPNEFVLGHTYERIQVPRNIVASLDGRSTVARIGLSIHCTSHMADGNFEVPNVITLEIKNEGNFNIILKPKIPIGMFVLHKLSDEIQQDVQFQYKNQSTVLPPDLKNQLK
jgi:dCTP deaminase